MAGVGHEEPHKNVHRGAEDDNLARLGMGHEGLEWVCIPPAISPILFIAKRSSPGGPESTAVSVCLALGRPGTDPGSITSIPMVP